MLNFLSLLLLILTLRFTIYLIIAECSTFLSSSKINAQISAKSTTTTTTTKILNGKLLLKLTGHDKIYQVWALVTLTNGNLLM